MAHSQHIGFSLLAAAVLFAVPATVSAAESTSVSFWQYPAASQTAGGFSVPASLLGGSMAIGDLGHDGIDEIVIGAPVGAEPLVNVLRPDGTAIGTFPAFEFPQKHPILVAVGDINGDNAADIAVSGDDGVVKFFDSFGVPATGFPPVKPFGDRLATVGSLVLGDMDGDGRDEVIVGAAAGETGAIGVIAADGMRQMTFFPFGEKTLDGVNVAAGDIDGDGKAEIAAAVATSGGTVRLFGGNALVFIREFIAIGNGFNGGLNMVLADLDADDKAELLAVPNGFGGPHVHVYSGDGVLKNAFFAFEEPYHGGVLLGAGSFAVGGTAQIVAIRAERNSPKGSRFAKYILVDVSEQRLRAYESGKMVRTFLVSTGVGKTTPRGEYRVLAKPEFVHYAGVGYDLGWVQYNLRFYPHIYIHYAPWHNDFGRARSHGCVNVNFESAKWVFHWADVGTPVMVQE